MEDSEKYEIRHRPFPEFGGRYQSFGVFEKGSEKLVLVIGTALPGRYEFPKIAHTEVINVTHGAIIINGITYTEEDGDCIVPAGQTIVFEVRNEPASLRVRFPDAQRRTIEP